MGRQIYRRPRPETHDGKPDLSGVWKPAPPYIGNIASDLKPGDAPFQPWAAELFKQRRATESKEDPTGNCIPGGVPRCDAVPYPFKIVNSEKMVVILYEAVHSYRQIFTDGRELPKDPNPTWQGYSIGHWEGDDFVAQTSGFNNQGWLDNDGRPATDALPRDRAFQAEKLRAHGYSDHHRRSESLHQALERDIAADAPARYRPARVCLQREQQGSAALGWEIR